MLPISSLSDSRHRGSETTLCYPDRSRAFFTDQVRRTLAASNSHLSHCFCRIAQFQIVSSCRDPYAYPITAPQDVHIQGWFSMYIPASHPTHAAHAWRVFSYSMQDSRLRSDPLCDSCYTAPPVFVWSTRASIAKDRARSSPLLNVGGVSTILADIVTSNQCRKSARTTLPIYLPLDTSCFARLHAKNILFCRKQWERPVARHRTTYFRSSA